MAIATQAAAEASLEETVTAEGATSKAAEEAAGAMAKVEKAMASASKSMIEVAAAATQNAASKASSGGSNAGKGGEAAMKATKEVQDAEASARDALEKAQAAQKAKDVEVCTAEGKRAEKAVAACAAAVEKISKATEKISKGMEVANLAAETAQAEREKVLEYLERASRDMTGDAGLDSVISATAAASEAAEGAARVFTEVQAAAASAADLQSAATTAAASAKDVVKATRSTAARERLKKHGQAMALQARLRKRAEEIGREREKAAEEARILAERVAKAEKAVGQVAAAASAVSEAASEALAANEKALAAAALTVEASAAAVQASTDAAAATAEAVLAHDDAYAFAEAKNVAACMEAAKRAGDAASKAAEAAQIAHAKKAEAAESASQVIDAASEASAAVEKATENVPNTERMPIEGEEPLDQEAAELVLTLQADAQKNVHLTENVAAGMKELTTSAEKALADASRVAEEASASQAKAMAVAKAALRRAIEEEKELDVKKAKAATRLQASARGKSDRQLVDKMLDGEDVKAALEAKRDARAEVSGPVVKPKVVQIAEAPRSPSPTNEVRFFDGQEEAFYPSDNEHMSEYEAGWGAQGDFGHRPNSTFRSSSKQRTIKPFEARLAQQLEAWPNLQHQQTLHFQPHPPTHPPHARPRTEHGVRSSRSRSPHKGPPPHPWQPPPKSSDAEESNPAFFEDHIGRPWLGGYQLERHSSGEDEHATSRMGTARLSTSARVSTAYSHEQNAAKLPGLWATVSGTSSINPMDRRPALSSRGPEKGDSAWPWAPLEPPPPASARAPRRSTSPSRPKTELGPRPITEPPPPPRTATSVMEVTLAKQSGPQWARRDVERLLQAMELEAALTSPRFRLKKKRRKSKMHVTEGESGGDGGAPASEELPPPNQLAPLPVDSDYVPIRRQRQGAALPSHALPVLGNSAWPGMTTQAHFHARPGTRGSRLTSMSGSGADAAVKLLLSR